MSKFFWLTKRGKVVPLTWEQKKRLLERHPNKRYTIAWVGGHTLGLYTSWHNGKYYENSSSVWVKAGQIADLLLMCERDGTLRKGWRYG